MTVKDLSGFVRLSDLGRNRVALTITMKTIIVFALTVFLVPFSVRCTNHIDDDIDYLDGEICDVNECPDTDDCDFGEVLDFHNCCHICAKGPGDLCGGMFHEAGYCRNGLVCIPHPKYHQLPGRCSEEETAPPNN